MIIRHPEEQDTLLNQGRRLVRSGARVLFLVLAWLLVAGLAVQVFLAGLGVFESPRQFEVHRDWGYLLELFPILMVVTGLVGAVGRRQVGLSAVIFGLFILQSVFIAFRGDAPAIAALHPVNGFLIFLLSIVVARTAWLERASVASATTA
jgi:hypothetical protein